VGNACRRSNMDVDGIWLFRVGDLRGENVQVPGSQAPTGNVCCAATCSGVATGGWARPPLFPRTSLWNSFKSDEKVCETNGGGRGVSVTSSD